MQNNLENKDILPENILEVMDILTKIDKDIVFGGSIALNAVGLLNRTIGDIDVFVWKNTNITETFVKYGKPSKVTSETNTGLNGEEIQRTGIIINDVKVCIFKVDKLEYLRCSHFKIFLKEYKMQNVNYAIMVKRHFAKHNKKHSEDLQEIERNLNSVF